MSLPEHSSNLLNTTSIVDPELLNPKELRLFELFGQGNTNSQLGENLDIAVSTVHTHKRSIRDRFGFVTPLAMREAGQSFTDKITTGSIAVQSKVVESIDLVKTAQQKTDSRVAVSNRPFSTIRNQNILNFLYENDYITEKMVKIHKIGLRGLVAALLLSDISTRPHVTDMQMRSYTREIIDREVGLAIEQG